MLLNLALLHLQGEKGWDEGQVKKRGRDDQGESIVTAGARVRLAAEEKTLATVPSKTGLVSAVTWGGHGLRGLESGWVAETLMIFAGFQRIILGADWGGRNLILRQRGSFERNMM